MKRAARSRVDSALADGLRQRSPRASAGVPLAGFPTFHMTSERAFLRLQRLAGNRAVAGALGRGDLRAVQRAWVEGDDGHQRWDQPLGDQTWFWNPHTGKLYYSDGSGRKSTEHTYAEWLAAGWRGLDRESLSHAMIGDPSGRPRAETPEERTLRARSQKVKGPFEEFGFSKVDYRWDTEQGRLAYDIDERRRDDHNQRIEGQIDPEGRGVVVGTIDLVPRPPAGKYDGLEEIGLERWQLPESVAEKGWQDAVVKGEERWRGIAKAAPRDAPSDRLNAAEKQNQLIYGLVQLAHEVLDLEIGPGKALQYVAHRHISSPDGILVMAYGRAKLGWKEKDVTLDASAPEKTLYALLGITNATFVQWLIVEFGNRLGISRLSSIGVRRGGYDVYWYFQ